MKYMPTVILLGILISFTSLLIFIALLILYPFLIKKAFLRKLLIIDGEELPPLATEEYRAEIEAGDVGAPFESGIDHLDDELHKREDALREAKKQARKKPQAGKTGGTHSSSIPPQKKP